MPKLRGGILTVSGAQAGVRTLNFKDSNEFNREAADNALFGIPVEMKREGSGSVEFESDTSIPNGYQTTDWLYTYTKVDATGGVETVTTKTMTFKNVTCNTGGDHPAASAGKRTYDFTYSYHTES